MWMNFSQAYPNIISVIFVLSPDWQLILMQQIESLCVPSEE